MDMGREGPSIRVRFGRYYDRLLGWDEDGGPMSKSKCVAGWTISRRRRLNPPRSHPHPRCQTPSPRRQSRRSALLRRRE